MTRESYCKDEWFHFEKCLGEHTDLKQIGTNVWKNLEKMKGRDPRTADPSLELFSPSRKKFESFLAFKSVDT